MNYINALKKTLFISILTSLTLVGCSKNNSSPTSNTLPPSPHLQNPLTSPTPVFEPAQAYGKWNLIAFSHTQLSSGTTEETLSFSSDETANLRLERMIRRILNRQRIDIRQIEITADEIIFGQRLDLQEPTHHACQWNNHQLTFSFESSENQAAELSLIGDTLHFKRTYPGQGYTTTYIYERIQPEPEANPEDPDLA